MIPWWIFVICIFSCTFMGLFVGAATVLATVKEKKHGR